MLDGDITEVIFAPGPGKNVVAVDISATCLPEAQALPKTGCQKSLSAGGTLSMEPTVVIGNRLAGPPEVIEQVRSTGTTVVIVESATWAASKIRNVAQALGVSDEGGEVATGLEVEIAEVKAVADAEDKPTAVLLHIGSWTRSFWYPIDLGKECKVPANCNRQS